MKWTIEAEDAVKRVPFFVRKRVRSRVEAEAAAEGKTTVGLAEVNATRKRYLSNMSSEIRGYRVESCFSSGECANCAADCRELAAVLEDTCKDADFLGFLKEKVGENLKFHHEFGVALAECPNACSRPQIRDIGIVGARVPIVAEANCSRCGECADACPDAAIRYVEDGIPEIDRGLCLNCGQCVKACPSGGITGMKTGYRVMLGGKLGRHPRLGTELPGIFGAKEVAGIVGNCIDFYMKNSEGKRFGEIIEEKDIDSIYMRKED